MKLGAVRLQEVGHFRSGIALEGLTGALDVVSGPNEMGKSTVFRAIDLAMRVQHTSTATVAKELAPVQGGAPLIEIDFEADGVRWRLRKRYLAQRVAELVDRDRRTLLRGADAENRLAQLLAGRLERTRMLGLLWVGQGGSHALPDGGRDGLGNSLGKLIEDEIADVAGNGQARRLHDAVRGALHALVTRARREPAAGSLYRIAVDARDLLREADAKARAAASAAAERQSQLLSVRAKLADLAAPEAAAIRAETLAGLRKARDEAAKAEEAASRARLLVEARQVEHERALDRSRAFREQIEEAGRLGARLAQARREHETAQAAVSEREAARALLVQRRSELEADIGANLALIEAHDRFERQRMARQEADDLRARLARVRTLTERVAVLDAAVTAEPIDERVIAEIRRAQAAVERLRAAIDAQSPRIVVDYAAGAGGSITSRGRAIEGSGPLEPAPHVELEIAGIGRIVIMSARADGRDVAAEWQAAEDRLGGYLAAVVAADVDAAERRFEERRQRVAERQSTGDQIDLLAHDGEAALVAALAAADARAAGAADVPPAVARGSAEAALVSARDRLRRCEAEVRQAGEAAQILALGVSRLDGEIATGEARLAALAATLPAALERDAALALLAREAASSEAALNVAVREHAAWTAGVPSDAARAMLERDITAAEQSEKNVHEQRQRLAFEVTALESALARDRQDGVDAVAQEAHAALATAEARVAAFEQEVAELEVLDRLLLDEAAASRDAHLKPVVDRLQEYAAGVFPGVRFELGDTLSISGLLRGGESYRSSKLSGGTAEQVAVLVRLAYARLLADRGEGMPLVLDDALVYADAERFRSMMTVLADAAQHHQVIMLTCQEDRIAALGTRPGLNLVSPRPWKPGESVVTA